MSFCKITIHKNDTMYVSDLKLAIKHLYPGISLKHINTAARYTFYYYVNYYPTNIYKAFEDACVTFNIEKNYLFNIQLNLDDDVLPVAKHIQFEDYNKKKVNMRSIYGICVPPRKFPNRIMMTQHLQ